jgi:NitT/TauT family transport system substrate-binding protein
VRLQLQWAQGAEFAGYLAAADLGFYEAAGIEVIFVEGGPEIRPQEVGSSPLGPEFTVSWVPKVLQARASGASDLVDIAQVFQRSGTLTIARTDDEVVRPADLRDRTVGVLGPGDELEIVAGAARAGLVAGTDFELVPLDLTMDRFLRGSVDVAQATIWDGYAQVLEAEDPETNALFQSTDLDVINWNDEGSAMLQDAIFARASWLEEGDNTRLAVDFLRASFQGWMHCRDRPAECVAMTMAAEPRLGGGHQAWTLNEVNGLIWPSPDGIGVVATEAWDAMVQTMLETDLLTTAPTADAFRTELAIAAGAGLVGQDVTGDAFVKGDVPITPGGE